MGDVNRDKGQIGRRKVLAAAGAGALTPLLGAAAATPANAQPANSPDPQDDRRDEMHARHRAIQPVPTVDADWQLVGAALGRRGKVMGGAVYRVGFPRRDLKVVSYGVVIAPGLALGSYATFTRYVDRRTLLMGDLVLTESELQPATDALHSHGLEQTAIHKHLLAHSPAIWWTHFHGVDRDPVALATGLRAALDVTGTPPPSPAPPTPPPVDLDTAAIDRALGAKGTNDGGIYKFTFARRETVTDHHRVLPPATGVTTALNFQPVGGGRAAINGDFAMIADEVQGVLVALRHSGINVIELHNHSLMDKPRLFYTHFWAVDDGVTLAKALHRAVDATNVRAV